MSDIDGIQVERRGAIAVVTLNRPEKLNALTPAMLVRMEAVAAELDAVTDVRAVILTGAGPKAFCVGADINEWSALAPLDMWRQWVPCGHRVFDRLAALRVPVIAAINGHALGGGLELAAVADIRIADPAATFALPEAGIAACPGWSGTQRLVSIIGASKVKLLALTGRRIDAIRIGNDRVNDLHPSERDIAMVFQSYALYPNMTVGQNISFGLEMRKVPKADREKSVADVAKLLQIEHLMKRRPSQLSGGQRQRVVMGRALVRDPKIFLFDEPLSNLDAKLRVDMRTEIKKLHQRLGATIVYVTHDQIEAMTLATRIAVMKGGAIQQFGTPAEIYSTPANTFVATFMGSPSMNLIPVALSARNGGTLVLTMGEGSAAISFDLPPQPAAVARYAGRKVIAGLRPEAIGVESSRVPDAVREVAVKVLVMEPTGPDTLAALEMGGVEVAARLGADMPHSPGENCNLQVDLSKLILFDAHTEERIA